MAYSSLTELQNRLSDAELVQLTDDAAQGVINPQVVAAAISEADGVIDSFLRGQTLVPLVNPPALIASISADLALYRLMARRGLAVAPEVLSLKDKAFALLEQLAKGEIRLFAPEDKGIAGKSRLASSEAEFNPELLRLF